MGVLDNLKGVLAQYASGGGAAADAAGHFDQVAQAADPGALARGIAAALHANPGGVGAAVSQLFDNATPDQKAAMLNTLLGAAPANLRAQLQGLVPGIGAGAVSGAQAGAVPANVIGSLAATLHQQGSGIVDTMSTFYAQHPTLVKTLGSAAMIVALRKIAERT